MAAIPIQDPTGTSNPHHPSLKSSALPLEAHVLPASHPQPRPQLPADCTICQSPFNTPRPDGTTETPSILPCAHIFGSICIKRWLESCQHQNCPNCRREMRYTGCGHAAIPKPLPKPALGACQVTEDADGESERKPVRTEDMPTLCLLCREGREMEEVVRRAERRLVVEERALEGLSVLPGLFGGLYKGSGVGSLGERTEEVKERWRDELMVLTEGLRGRMEGKEEW